MRLSIYLSIYLYICLSYLSNNLSIYLYICMYDVYLNMYLNIYTDLLIPITSHLSFRLQIATAACTQNKHTHPNILHPSSPVLVDSCSCTLRTSMIIWMPALTTYQGQTHHHAQGLVLKCSGHTAHHKHARTVWNQGAQAHCSNRHREPCASRHVSSTVGTHYLDQLSV